MRPIEAPQCARLLEQIESELKRQRCWQEAALAPDKFIDMGAFGANKMAFEQWLQFVFLPAVKDTLAGQRQAPKSSSVGVYACRNFDGNQDRDTLVHLLSEFDHAFEQEVCAPSHPAAT